MRHERGDPAHRAIPAVVFPDMAPSSADDEDETLIARALEGDQRAREELFRRHWGIARRVAFRLLGHEQDAEDAVQAGLIKALAHLDEFDGRSRFRTWLLRIVTNAALDLGRRRKRRPAASLAILDANGHEPAESPDPAAGLHRDDLRHALDRALGQLSPTLRTTFVLFAEAGLSYKEIAECQAVPIGTVMSRIYEARQKLQARLEDWKWSKAPRNRDEE